MGTRTSQSQNQSMSRSMENRCNRKSRTDNIKNKLKNTKLTRKWWKDSCQHPWSSKATPNGHMDGTKIKMRNPLGMMLETTRRKRVISHKRVKQMALLMTNITTITSMATLIISTGITVKTNPIKLIIQIVQKMEAQMAKNSKKLKLPLPQSKMKQQSNNLQLD